MTTEYSQGIVDSINRHFDAIAMPKDTHVLKSEQVGVHEQASSDYAEYADEMVQDEVFRGLIGALAHERNMETSDMNNPELTESEFIDGAQVGLDFRNGQQRDKIKNMDFAQSTIDFVEDSKEKFGMTVNTVPKNPDFDAACVYGGAGDSPAQRLRYARSLMEQGLLNTDTLFMMGSSRPLNMKPDANGKTEVDRAGPAGYNKSGVMAKDEYDLMRNTAAVSYDIADENWYEITGYDDTIPEHHHYAHKYRIAVAEKDGKRIVVTDAHMLSDARLDAHGNPRNRANTADTLLFLAKMFEGQIAAGDTPRLLGVSNAIFAGKGEYPAFQASAQESRLAPLGIESEMVGFNREFEGKADWTPAQYIQEILSGLRHIRSARDYLSKNEQHAA